MTPSLFQGYSRLGTALSFLKKYPEAEKVFLQGLEHEPNNAQLQGGLEEVQSQLTGDAFSYNNNSSVSSVIVRVRVIFRKIIVGD